MSSSLQVHHDPYGVEAGAAIECLSHAVEVHKERIIDKNGQEIMRIGFKIGGGIDQDPAKSPYGYPDTWNSAFVRAPIVPKERVALGIYITMVEPNSPAEQAGLKQHDKILQVNGYDLTMVPHEKAVKYIKKYPVLKMLVYRRDMPAKLAQH